MFQYIKMLSFPLPENIELLVWPLTIYTHWSASKLLASLHWTFHLMKRAIFAFFFKELKTKRPTWIQARVQTRNPKPRTSHHSQAFSDLTHASQLKDPKHENFGSEFLTPLKPLKFRIMGPDSNQVRHEIFWADQIRIRIIYKDQIRPFNAWSDSSRNFLL